MNDTDTDTGTDTIRGSTLWLTFRMGAQLYAALLADVNEVIRDGELTPVPGAAADMLGVRHLRGRIVPVMDGRRRLGLPAQPEPDPVDVRIVMLAKGGQVVGLKVDAVGELIDSTGVDVAPPPAGRVGRQDDPVSGVLAWRGGFVALLDVRKLCRLETGDADQA
jgi:purine-binding chemotaxis protein CheW